MHKLAEEGVSHVHVSHGHDMCFGASRQKGDNKLLDSQLSQFCNKKM